MPRRSCIKLIINCMINLKGRSLNGQLLHYVPRTCQRYRFSVTEYSDIRSIKKRRDVSLFSFFAYFPRLLYRARGKRKSSSYLRLSFRGEHSIKLSPLIYNVFFLLSLLHVKCSRLKADSVFADIWTEDAKYGTEYLRGQKLNKRNY